MTIRLFELAICSDIFVKAFVRKLLTGCQVGSPNPETIFGGPGCFSVICLIDDAKLCKEKDPFAFSKSLPSLAKPTFFLCTTLKVARFEIPLLVCTPHYSLDDTLTTKPITELSFDKGFWTTFNPEITPGIGAWQMPRELLHDNFTQNDCCFPPCCRACK